MSRLLFGLTVPLLLFAFAARSQSVANSHSTFEQYLNAELAKYADGKKLYRECDVFARMIDRRIAQKYSDQLRNSALSEPLNQDTISRADISRLKVDEDEPSIAVSRSNPNVIVAGANDDNMAQASMPAYISTNAGSSWTTFRLPLVMVNAYQAYGDPMIVSDDKGTFYYSFLIANDFGWSDLMVAHSTDGVHWTLGNPVLGKEQNDTAFEDKETIAIDRNAETSPHYGRLYIAWTKYLGDTNGSAIHLIAHSDDKGATWSTPVQYTTRYGYFALLRIGQGGTVFISSSKEPDSTTGHGLSISEDGGETFHDVPIADVMDYPRQPFQRGLKGPNGFRAFPYAAFDVDPLSNHIYMAFGSYDDMADAAIQRLAESTDKGIHWTNPKMIGNPSLLGNDHFDPWITFDPILKHPYVVLYSSEEDPTLNLFTRAVTCDFSSPSTLLPLSSRLFDPLVDTVNGWDFIGDYIGADAYNGTFAAAWTENRPGHTDGDIFAYVSAPVAAVDPVQQINAFEANIGDITPNPSFDRSSLTASSNTATTVALSVYNTNGVRVLCRTMPIDPGIPETLPIPTNQLSAGVYRVVVSLQRQSFVRNLVVLH